MPRCRRTKQILKVTCSRDFAREALRGAIKCPLCWAPYVFIGDTQTAKLSDYAIEGKRDQYAFELIHPVVD